MKPSAVVVVEIVGVWLSLGARSRGVSVRSAGQQQGLFVYQLQLQ